MLPHQHSLTLAALKNYLATVKSTMIYLLNCVQKKERKMKGVKYPYISESKETSSSFGASRICVYKKRNPMKTFSPPELDYSSVKQTEKPLTIVQLTIDKVMPSSA